MGNKKMSEQEKRGRMKRKIKNPNERKTEFVQLCFLTCDMTKRHGAVRESIDVTWQLY
jgi:hypothetical protein